MANVGLQNFGLGTAVDSSGNMYICGYREDVRNDFYLVKLNPQGTIVWQTVLSNTSTSIGYSVKVDSSGNVYVAGLAASSGNDVFEVAKYNSSGVLQWQKRFGNGALGATAYSLALDSSANVYVGGRYYNGGTYDFMLLKYDSAGTIQWRQKYAASSYDCYGQGVTVDSSGNIYITGYTNMSASWDMLLLKYDSSGTLLWQRKLGVGSTEIANAVATDSSGNVYICGYSNTTGADALVIAKYNSSGTVQWQKFLENGQAQGYGITIDSSNNIYVCGHSRYFGSQDMYVAKYDTSGTIQWQRRIGNNTNSEQGRSVAVDGQGNVYLAGIGQVSGVWNILYAKLPADGSKTGTYVVGGVSYIYGSGALSESTQTMTSNAPVYSSAAVTYTAADSTLTTGTPALTTSVTTI